ncbi:TonB-dependent receptor [uncultured Aquimarina sp.]|uniref:TonB-dependent receptor domain-containing protein n=1 Tax=uncultured Aquimarina sp. TaxID=575652 RepID=UPI002612C874|nr:TonB-dependent receptor [uncultured Aquimarina sp.]
MKKIILLLFLFLYYVTNAQFNISGLVIDNTTLTHIKNATIVDVETGNKTFSNNNGTFNFISNGTIEISFSGYQTKKIIITNDQSITISLNPDINLLQEVIINSQSISLQKKYATDAVAIISNQEINRGNTIELNPILNKVPGVFMQNGTLNTNRITIRGIGARNLFGTANIRTYFGDIPLTDGNGESSIEDLELASISRIDIHKGPSSSSYGVGLGGTILLRPEFIDRQATEAVFSSSLGSYGLSRNIAKIAIGSKKSTVNIIYSNNHFDGYRDNNTYNRNTVTVTSSIHSGEKNNFSIIASYVDLKAEIPSSLNQDDFDNNPRNAAFTWGQSQAFEDIMYGILGLTWKHDYNQSFSQHTSIFTSFRNNYEPRPFNILKETSNTIGIRSRIVGVSNFLNKKWNWTAGGELFLDFYNGKTFENLYEDFPIGTGSVLGNQLSDLDEKRNYYNVFAETNLKLNDKLQFNLGIHLNQTFFDIDDEFLSDNEDSSGSFDFDPILSPKVGLNYQLNSNFILFGNIAHGFSTPTTSETLLPDGVFNPDIRPEIGWNYEIGTRYKFLKSKLYGSISIYTLRVQDLLVTRRTEEDNFFAINAGKTIHNGIEAALNYRLLKTRQTQLNLFINATINDYEFDDFVDLDADFSGNDVTGVPSHVINLGIDLITKKGIYGNLNFQTVGEIPANDQNTVFSNHYELLHGKIGYTNTIGKHVFYDLFLGANNILDTKYASQLQINARGFGGNAPRYFYPGLPFNMYGGINIKYRL